MTKLSVNINKIATIRNARGGNIPDVPKAAIDCQRFGADGITVHPRPDERHIRYKDVYDIKPLIVTEFNIEGYPSRNFINLIKNVKPQQVTLVPDPPDVLTSNAGWDTKENLSFLQDIIAELKSFGVRVSIFLDTEEKNLEYAKETGTDRIELYTEPYAANYDKDREKAVAPFVKAAEYARKQGLGINAGHDLNLENLHFFSQSIPFLDEVSIGHALISDALYFGLENTIQLYKSKLVK
ncbi:MAG: pyridoxine 5'-phosphate synthase [Marinilabiliales bacterium]